MISMKNKYYRILSDEYPSFIDEYCVSPCLQRLSGISLFCGVDYCGLFRVKEFYSRLDHSIGVALIIWHFTKDKKATIAGLLHDVSTPVFSHVIDFMYKDYLKQEKTEEKNSAMILLDSYLCTLLKRDGIDVKDVMDYKMYPIADNEVPQLSADRLEYMYSTGLFLTQDYDLDTIEKTYKDLYVSKNEEAIDELAFKDISLAEEFSKQCCNVGRFFQTNEDKMALEYLSRIVKDAIDEKVFNESDVYSYREEEIWERMYMKGSVLLKEKMDHFANLHTVIPSDNYVESECTIHMNVKKRYIDPLVNSIRVSLCSKKANKYIQDFIQYKESEYAYIDETCYK